MGETPVERRTSTARVPAGVWALLFLLGASPATGGSHFGGSMPEQDPAESSASIAAAGRRDAAWRKAALHGIAPTPPASVLRIVQQQGEWYSPFFHPGMTGPYDLRGWHAPTAN